MVPHRAVINSLASTTEPERPTGSSLIICVCHSSYLDISIHQNYYHNFKLNQGVKKEDVCFEELLHRKKYKQFGKRGRGKLKLLLNKPYTLVVAHF